MNGIVSAAQGTLPRDAEMRFTQSGLPMLSFSVAVHDAKRAEGAETEWLKVVVWGELAEQLHAGGALVKGTEVYAEGRLKLDQWTAADGQQRSGLSLSAWKVEPMGQIGRRRPPRREAVGNGHRAALAQTTAGRDA
jgi:single-strand DNA-binding protein